MEDIISHNLRVIGKALRGEPVTFTEAAITAFTSLTAAAVLVPLAVQTGYVAYEEAKKRGYIR